MLAIGISNYNNRDLHLQFPAKDASDFTQAMLRQAGLLYERVELKLLADRSATEMDIRDGLNWLQTQTTNRDIAMLFMAGHGVNNAAGDFYFMPVNADIARINSTCVGYKEIKNTISNVPGKLLVFLDACHSGNVMGGQRTSSINNAVNEIASASNAPVVYTSSTEAQYSLESPEWNNGAFTKALIEGLIGKADLRGTNTVTVLSLDYYIAQRVKELTRGQQAPTTIIPQSVTDYPIAMVTGDTFIPSASSTVKTNVATADIKGTLTVDAIKPQNYTGSRITPAVTVRDGAAELIKGIDYTVTYGENVNAGGTAGKIMITGVGSYDGNAGNATFAIAPKTIIFSVDIIAAQTFTSRQIKPAITVRDGDKALQQELDFTVDYGANINVGNDMGSVTVTGAGNYTGSEGSKRFSITPKVITFTVDDIAPQTFSGKQHAPAVVVKDGENTLTAGTDYTVHYGENIVAGANAGSVVIAGAGNYAGSAADATFAIVPKTINIDAVATQTYTGKQITPKVTVNDGDKLLTPGVDYTVSYGENTNMGADAGTIAISGMGAYAGSANTVTFNIASKVITIDAIEPQTYTGKPITPEVTVKEGATTLTAGTDYTVNYGENTNAGTGSVTVTGTGIYAGCNENATFTIRHSRELVMGVSTGASAFGKVSIGEIKNGYSNLMSADATLYMNKNFGMGLKWNMKTGEVNFGETTYKESATFFGPALYLRLTNQKRLAFIAGAGIGALNWKWNISKSENATLDNSATSVGAFFTASVNFMATQHLGFSVNMQTVTGKMTSDYIVRKPAAIGATAGVNFRF